MIKKIRYKFGENRFECSYDARILSGEHSQIIKKTISEYAKSKSPKYSVLGCPNIADAFCLPRASKNENVPPPEKEKKHFVMFSGGKDSAHLLISIIAQAGQENVKAGYVCNLNRSESPYEKESCQKICDKLGVKLYMISPVNGIKGNRSGHAIGLRDQLIVSLMLPFIDHERCHVVHFGHTKDFWFSDGKGIPTGTRRVTDAYLEFICRDIEIRPNFNNLTEAQVLMEMLKEHRWAIDLGSSCYTQKNFREQQNKNFRKKFGSGVYHGCGVCVKCARINMGMCLKSGDLRLAEHIQRRHGDDAVVAELYRYVNGAQVSASGV